MAQLETKAGFPPGLFGGSDPVQFIIDTPTFDFKAVEAEHPGAPALFARNFAASIFGAAAPQNAAASAAALAAASAASAAAAPPAGFAAPLADRLAYTKRHLNSVVAPLAAALGTSDPTPEQDAAFAANVVDPLLPGFVAAVGASLAAIEAATDEHRAAARTLSKHDRSTYNNQFGKSIERASEKVAYDRMVKTGDTLAASISMPAEVAQPFTNLLEIHRAVAKQKDGFIAALNPVLEGTRATVSFRLALKAFFRCLEKALL